MWAMLRDPVVAGRLFHRFTLNVHWQWAGFDKQMPAHLRRVERFEDLWWLYSSNSLNHGISGLMLVESTYLFRLVSSLEAPNVAEIGRFKGGTTFLLAAAGARRVLSIEISEPIAGQFDPKVLKALDQVGLVDRVDLVIGDASTHPVSPGAFDLVYLDGDYSYEGTKAAFEHWRPALRPGGHLVMHNVDRNDARAAFLQDRFFGLWRLIDELDREPGLRRVPLPTEHLVHFVVE